MATHFNFLLLLILFSFISISSQQNDVVTSPQITLDSTEQESVYRVLESVNSAIPWRTLFPDDLCVSSPDGVVCDYFFTSQNDVVTSSVHVTEFHLGYVSDYTQNPPCSSNSSLNPLLFTSFKYLRKLFFYKCFTGNQISLTKTISEHFGSVLEEIVFIENPSLVGNLTTFIGNFTNLKRLVLTGNGFHGFIPDRVGDFVNLEEITLSRNRLSGNVPMNLTSRLSNLKVLDLSYNFLDGNAPGFVGDLTELLKLDLSFNGFTGEIPSSVGKLKKLEFLDLSYNRFGNFGVPLFLAEMSRLKEVYLSGNQLGGVIPEIWDNLGGILGIGFSKMGLEGNIPASMALSSKNLCYLALDNNNLQGEIPKEFEFLEFAWEINLENNNFTGKVPFSNDFRSKLGKKLKINGNPGLILHRNSLNSDPPLTGPDLTSSTSRAITSFYRLMCLLFLSFLIKQ